MAGETVSFLKYSLKEDPKLLDIIVQSLHTMKQIESRILEELLEVLRKKLLQQ